MISPIAELRRFIAAALIVPVRPRPPAVGRRELTRRRVIAGLTIVAGAVLLTLTVRTEPGSTAFFVLGLVLAAVWLVGAVASGPLRLGTARTRAGGRSLAVVQSLALAAALIALFLAGALVVAQLPGLRNPVLALLEHNTGPQILVVLVTVVNGIAEEVFFRGALYSAIGASVPAVVITTLLYGLTTVGSGVPLLSLAAVMLGVVTALQRRVTGGVLGPIITHVTWSVAMLLLLPLVLDLAR
ncbi:CPBP family intramembrane glutamic endopeptidase [Cumulibacter manganitolerans]|uniref:CPBP family intramembrane glutamic endopeptidase n=1 Tax=Cumulibacter manganitolerans TaxID=1884992 RepID=UPI0012968FB7|nr:CPBP family intramembrane glutamic endopeptidase [Cumulibacter manganitolerans]